MGDRSNEILAWIGRAALEGRVPAGRDEAIAMLVHAGFDPGEVARALDGAETPAEGADRPRSQARAARRGGRVQGRPLPVAQLSDDATHFLNVLGDLGYLDDAMEDEVLDAVMEEFADARRNVELEDLRRHVATVLFDRQYEMDTETIKLIEQEWRIAFY